MGSSVCSLLRWFEPLAMWNSCGCCDFLRVEVPNILVAGGESKSFPNRWSAKLVHAFMERKAFHLSLGTWRTLLQPNPTNVYMPLFIRWLKFGRIICNKHVCSSQGWPWLLPFDKRLYFTDTLPYRFLETNIHWTPGPQGTPGPPHPYQKCSEA